MADRRYLSVLLTLDPALNAQIAQSNYPDASVDKFVFSTMGVLQRLSELFNYYNLHEVGHSPETLEMIAASGAAENPVFILQTSRNTEILMSADLLGDIADHPDFGGGNLLLAQEKVTEVVARAQQDVYDRTGGFARLLMLDFSFGEAGSRDEPLSSAAE